MPIAYRIDSQARLVRTVASGVVVDKELREHEDRLAADPDFDASMPQLVDGRSIDRLDVTALGVRQFVIHEGRHQERFSRHRVAIVVPEDLSYGMARMYQTMSHIEVGVFRTIEEALAFLGRTPA